MGNSSSSHRLIALALSSAMMLSGEPVFAIDADCPTPPAQHFVLTFGGQPLREALNDPLPGVLPLTSRRVARTLRD